MTNDHVPAVEPTLFPGFQHVFLLQDPFNNRWMRADYHADADSLRVLRGESPPPESVTAVWSMNGSTPSDFVWTTSVHPVIVHKRVATALLEHGITGWHSYSVEVVDRRKVHHHDYVGLAIVGRAGPVDLSQSAVVLQQYPGGWFPHFRGYYFDPSSWDGSNIFMHHPHTSGETTSHVMLDLRAAAVLRSLKAKNVSLTALTDVSTDTSVYVIGSPHLLPRTYERDIAEAYHRAGVPRPE